MDSDEFKGQENKNITKNETNPPEILPFYPSVSFLKNCKII